MSLIFLVENQSISWLNRENTVASDSRNYLSGEVRFGEGWENLASKWLTFERRDGTEDPIKILLDGDKFTSDAHLTLSAGDWYVSAHGINSDGETYIPTVQIMITVEKAGGEDGDAPLYVAPDEAQQILAVATEAKNAAEGAVPAKEAAEAARDEAANSAENALYAAYSADTSSSNAYQSASDAAASAELAANNILNGVSEHNIDTSAHPDIQQDIRTVEAIARGKARAHVFDTKADMESWLESEDNTSTLSVGDNLYIRDTGVPDYWWDGSSAQRLEAEAPDLSDYATSDELAAATPIPISQSSYDALVSAGSVASGKVYFVYPDEEESQT